jgi:hypothetical protein
MKNRLAGRILGSSALACCLGLTACSTMTGNPAPGPPATVAYVWRTNYPTFEGAAPQTIGQYSTATPQASSPVGTLTLPFSCDGGPIATASDGQIYVACFSPSSSPQILVYPPNSTGAATPSRTIELSSSSYEIATLTVDAHGNLYVGSLENTSAVEFTINIYSPEAHGLAPPLRAIQMNTYNGLTDIAVDAVGNIYVDGYPSVDGYNPGGPVSFVDVYSYNPYVAKPIRTLNFPFYTYGVGVDALGDMFVSAGVGSAGNVTALEEYAPGASGYPSPMNTIALPEQPAGMIVGGSSVRFDRAGNMFTAVYFFNLSTPMTYILYSFGPPAAPHASPVVEINSKDSYNTAFALN